MAGARLPARAIIGITIGGDNVTAIFRPFLLTVTVVDKDNAGGEIDECTIELDDSYGQLRLPATGESIFVVMGWVAGEVRELFDGFVSDVESGFSRDGGRRLWIQGKGADPTGIGKQPTSDSWGDGKTQDVPLQQVLSDAASNAGYAMIVAPTLAALTRKYWSQNRESFWNFGQRLARELGGTFKVAGMVASLSSATEQVSATGAEMAIVTAAWGDNLLQWRVRPIVGRPIQASVKAEFFDPTLAQWDSSTKKVGIQDPYRADSEHLVRYASQDKQTSEQDPLGSVSDSKRKRGTGWVLMDGEPSARAGGTCVLAGTREGVDGSYRITEAEHTWGRDTGYITRCNLENPQAGIGRDNRKTDDSW
jgi:phage protein D